MLSFLLIVVKVYLAIGILLAVSAAVAFSRFTPRPSSRVIAKAMLLLLFSWPRYFHCEEVKEGGR